jgi:hypothetical protein
LTVEELESSRYMRIKHVQGLQAEGRLDVDLRWKAGFPESLAEPAVSL